MKAVVAEDEALLREELLSLLREAWPGLEIVACEDGGAAVEAIDEHHPEVAFLDIRMPGLTGLEVAAAAAEASPATQVVFVTAYNQYAIDAFDRGAVDYLLKPISRERLAETVKRVKARAAAGGADSAALAALVDKLRDKLPAESRRPPLAWITANVGKETRLILVDDIAYFQADNKYTVVMTADGEALIRKTIRELLDELDPAIFKQIHRSTIVNMRAIAAVTRDESGRGTIRLKSRRETLPVSLTFMPIFRSM
ncbi:MAG TPA: LytTR family DNA-binding domain-containing protein [Usitatibacter sp.]|nr:LytTR family DNA-binding domain-containing protein [Usitatibacter sp.]